jgi:hypothetical protein
VTIGELVNQIDTFNRAWKVAIQRYGSASPISMGLRDRKTDLQLMLLSEFPGESSLELDEAEFEEQQYSIRLDPAVTLPNGSKRGDANHIPSRIANEFMTSPTALKEQSDY